MPSRTGVREKRLARLAVVDFRNPKVYRRKKLKAKCLYSPHWGRNGGRKGQRGQTCNGGMRRWSNGNFLITDLQPKADLRAG